MSPITLSADESVKQIRFVEMVLILVCLALVVLLGQLTASHLLVLHLFFLPITLAGFFLGRYRSGVLALLCVIGVTVMVGLNLEAIAGGRSPLLVGLEIAIWSASLGLCSLLTGTLSDERQEKISEINEAHIGVVEVLTRYLQGANPEMKARTYRVADLCAGISQELKLPRREVEDIRIAALLAELEHVEVTTRVIRKAVGGLSERSDFQPYTFQGIDLVGSLGQVFSGAFSLLDSVRVSPTSGKFDQPGNSAHAPIGTRIIELVRAYADICQESNQFASSATDALLELKSDSETNFHPAAVHALEVVLIERGEIEPTTPVAPPEPTNSIPMPVG